MVSCRNHNGKLVGHSHNIYLIQTDTVKRSASIVYVDYGNKEEKQFDELFAVDSSQDEIIRSTFWLAIECELDGITGSIDETTIEKFIELTSAADDDEVCVLISKH